MLKSFLSLVIRLLGFVIPVKLVSTFMGIGFLPAWQEHWSALAVLMLSHIACYMVYGSLPPLFDSALSGLIVAPFFLQIALCLLVLGLISIFIFMREDRDQGLHNEAIVAQVAFGQLFTVPISMPAVVALYEGTARCYDKVCAGIFMCPLWLNYAIHLLIFFIIPFVFYNLLIIIKPWPISMLQLRYNNCISIMSQGLVLSLYSAIVMYIVAFIYAGLQATSAVQYSKVILLLTFSGFAT